VKPLAMLGGRMAPEPSQYTTETMALVEGLLARCAARPDRP
jgi:hypothetical protein